MTVAEYLGWARSLLDSYGLTPAITALIVILIGFTLLQRFFGRGD